MHLPWINLMEKKKSLPKEQEEGRYINSQLRADF